MKRSFKLNALARQISKLLLTFGCFLTLIFSYQIHPSLRVAPAFSAPLTYSQIAAAGMGNQLEGQAKEIQGKVKQSLGSATNQADGLGKQIQGKVQQDVGRSQRAVDTSTSQVQGAARQVQGKAQRNIGKTQDAIDKAGDRLEDTNRGVVGAVKDFFGK